MIQLVEVTPDVRQSLVFLGRRRSSEARAEIFLLLQRPVNDDRVGQSVGFGGEWLSHQIAETAGVNVGDLRPSLTASDIFEDSGAL